MEEWVKSIKHSQGFIGKQKSCSQNPIDWTKMTFKYSRSCTRAHVCLRSAWSQDTCTQALKITPLTCWSCDNLNTNMASDILCHKVLHKDALVGFIHKDKHQVRYVGHSLSTLYSYRPHTNLTAALPGGSVGQVMYFITAAFCLVGGTSQWIRSKWAKNMLAKTLYCILQSHS